MNMEICCPNFSSGKKFVAPAAWDAISRQPSAVRPFGAISAAEPHLTQGQIFPRAAHIQWLTGSLGHIVTWYPTSELAAFSVTWYLARALFLGVECALSKPEKSCQMFCFLVYGSRCKIQEFVLLWRAYPSIPSTTGLLKTLLKWQISELCRFYFASSGMPPSSQGFQCTRYLFIQLDQHDVINVMHQHDVPWSVLEFQIIWGYIIIENCTWIFCLFHVNASFYKSCQNRKETFTQ